MPDTFLTRKGCAITADRVAGAGTYTNPPKWCGIGTGSGQGTAANALATEVESRSTGAVSVVTVTHTNDGYRVIATSTTVSGRVVTEAGLFSANAAGDMFMYGDFASITTSAGEAIQFTFTIRYST